MLRLCSVFLSYILTSLIEILGFLSGYLVHRSKPDGGGEGNGSTFRINHSQEDGQLVPKNSTGFFSDGKIAGTEEVGLIARYQFVSGKDARGYFQEPRTEKLVVQEMFVGSCERNDQSLDCGNFEAEGSLGKALQGLDEGSDTSALSFKLFNASWFANGDGPLGVSGREEDCQEPEKIGCNDSEEFGRMDVVGDGILEEKDVSFEDEASSGNWMESFLEESDQIRPKLSIDYTHQVDDYIEIEPQSSGLMQERVSCEDGKCNTLNQPRESHYSRQEDGDDDDDENDVLLEHQHLVQQMKMELKSCRIRGLPTISEECETPKIAEDLKPLHIDHKLDYKDVVKEIQKFYKSYTEKMRKLDILNYQTLHAISFLQLNVSEVIAAGNTKGDWMPFVLSKMRPYKVQRICADPMHKSVLEMHHNLELVYVGQVCLSWEILCWMYMKARELLGYDPEGSHSYTRVADEFQQFQVLMQRFVEDEQFQGQRMQNYVTSRCMIKCLLQVPTIRDDCSKTKNEQADAVSLETLIRIIKESMLIFRDFLLADKRSMTTLLKLDPQSAEDSQLLFEIIADLHKKERKIRDNIRSQNCIVKKLKRQHRDDDDVAVLTSQLELKLVARVLSLSRLTRDQLIWCQNKMKNMNFVRREVHLEPTFLLFPC